MQKLILFKVSENHFAIDQDIVKQRYKKEELFNERSSRAKRVKIKLDGNDIPLCELPVIFNEAAPVAARNDSEAMLIKDDQGHMVLLVDQLAGTVEVEKEHIKDVSPIFGERSCRTFPKVMTHDNLPVLILSPRGIRAYMDEEPASFKKNERCEGRKL